MTESLVVCSKCGTVNRLPPSRPAMDAKCGKCGIKLFAGHPEDVDAETFDRQIARSTMPVLVDVWAPRASPSTWSSDVDLQVKDGAEFIEPLASACDRGDYHRPSIQG